MAKKKRKGSKKSAKPRQQRQAETPAPEKQAGEGPGEAPSRAWLPVVLLVLLLGELLALYLTRLHLHLFYGEGIADSLCDLGGTLSCSDVNASSQSSIFGIPNALLAIPTYALMGFLAWRVFLDGRRSSSSGLLFGLSGLSVGYSLYLAYVSKFVVGAWCLFCIGLYGVNLAVLVLAWRGSKLGPKELFSLGVAGLGKLGPPILGGAAVFFLTFGLSWAMYSGARTELSKAQAQDILEGAQPEEALVQQQGSAPSLPQAPVVAGDLVGGKARPVRVSDQRVELDLPADAPRLGPAHAPVTIVEMSDFQCPFCKRLRGNLHQLLDEYPGKVQLQFLNFPMHMDCNEQDLAKNMHPYACGAAVAGVCAKAQGKFWPMHDELFRRQRKLGSKEYGRMAKRLGLDEGAFAKCMKDPKSWERVKADTRIGKAVGVTGTPALFINGRRLAGAQPIEVLRAVVDAELKGETGAIATEVQVGAEILGEVNGPSSVEVDWGSHAFSIDAFEASLEGDKAVSVAGKSSATGVTWFEAKEACAKAGRRLCTEEEWVTACTAARPADENNNGIFSDDPILGNEYAYGSYYRSGACADSRSKAAPGPLITGEHPNCRTLAGVYDLHGLTKEWVGVSANRASIKGGSYFSGDSARCAYNRDDYAPDTVDPSIGFRCCEGPVPELDEEAARSWPGGKVGDELMLVEGQALGGKRWSSKSLKGHPVILTFWASWCGPCKKEMPMLDSFAKEFSAQGLRVVGISIDEHPEKAKAWVAEHKISFPVVLDPQGEISQGFDTRGVPTTFWIARDGSIRQRTVGIPGGGEKRLRQLAEELVR